MFVIIRHVFRPRRPSESAAGPRTPEGPQAFHGAYFRDLDDTRLAAIRIGAQPHVQRYSLTLVGIIIAMTEQLFQRIVSIISAALILSRYGLPAVLGTLTLISPEIAKASDEVIAIVHVNIVPMDEERVLRDQTVLISNGVIVAIGPRLPVPPGASVINGENRWLSPGLLDMHVHSDTREDLAVYLANGITTIANMGGANSGFVGRIAPASTAGQLPGPRVYNAFVVDGSPRYGHFTVTTPDEARAVVGLARTNGYQMVKVYNNLAEPVFEALAAECARQNMPLVGHGVTAVGLRRQVAAGQVLVAHAEEFFYTFFSRGDEIQTDNPPPASRIGEAVTFAKQHGIAVGADLVTYQTIMRQIGHPEFIETALQHPQAANVSPTHRLAWRRSSYFARTANLSDRYNFLAEMLRAMAQNEVLLLAGTDAPAVPGVAAGFALHDNLQLLERAGLTRFQVMATATRDPGRFIFGRLNGPLVGTITVGARADLLLTERNPLDDLNTLRSPVGVMRDGRWFDASRLTLMLQEVADLYRQATP
jgi:hypothetical protein